MLVLDPPVGGRHIVGRPMPPFVGIPAVGLAATGHQVSSGGQPADIFLQNGGFQNGPPFYNGNAAVPGDFFSYSYDILSGSVIIEDIQLGQ